MKPDVLEGEESAAMPPGSTSPRIAEELARRHAPPARMAPALLLTKLRPPPARRQWVVRERLLERLRPEPGIRLTALVAPPGSGKTTLLGTWVELEASSRPVGWVSLDEADNDPIVLWSHVLESLRRVCPALETSYAPERVGAAGIVDAFLPDLMNGLSGQDDVALVLDDFQHLSGRSRESVAWLIKHAPPTFQLVIATRVEPALPLAALRAHGELLEVRAADLAFTDVEADALLNDRLGLDLEHDELEALVARTEGWPAGLYLAALSLRGAHDRHAFVSRFGGETRGVIDFLVDEVLEAHDAEMQALMLRCSVLERLCGPLCDAVLESDGGSARRLSKLARTNLFLVPLDEHGQWYRFHNVFAQLLRVELEHREPSLAPTLERRASLWHRDHGSTDDAIEHALSAGAFAEAGELILTRWLGYARASRARTVLAWLERFPPEVLEADAALLHVKAWVLSVSARRDEAAQAIATAERQEGLAEGPLPDGVASVEAGLAALRAAIPWGDVGAGHRNAVRAAELERPQSPLWPTVCWSRGMGHFFRGELLEADPWFDDAARFAPSVESWVEGSALAYRSFIAGEQGDLEQQLRFAERAMHVVRERGIDEIDGEVPVALATALAARGDLEEARPLLGQGVEALRAYGQPLELAHALIRQVPVLRSLGESDAAAAALAEARATVEACPDPGLLDGWLAALEGSLRDRSGAAGDELTQRERVVLRALSGPLTERDIGRELYLSRNTIHSQTRSIYRKLRVSSRREAVGRARELGLL